MRSPWLALAAFAACAAAADPAAVERGRYVAAAANCVSCHTRDGGAAFAGGRALRTPLGTIYSTNITPDRRTGIGNWRAADLKRALREGVAADGRHLFPAFPYPFYTRLTDADIADLYAWLRTLKPVSYTPPANDAAFRLRWPLKAWKSLNLEAGPYRSDPARSAEWNRGAYLVQGAGHCGACHTPRDWSLSSQAAAPLRGAVMQDGLKGGRVRDWHAADLTSSRQGLGAWSVDEIAGYLGTGASARAASFGPMNAVIANGTSRLAREDLRAIAVYLKSLAGEDRAGEAPPAEAVKAGRPAYERHCRECHGPSGRGGPFDGPPLAGSAIVQGESPASLINIVLEGSDSPAALRAKGWETMPAFADEMDDGAIAALANFLRGSWGNRAPPVSPEDVARQR